MIQLVFPNYTTAQNKTIQEKHEKYVGEWKSYLSDKTTFEYLKRNSDRTGIKAIGKTINGKDTILNENHSFLKITHWEIEKKKLIIKTKYNLTYEPNNVYEIKFVNKDSIVLLGDHFELGIYPSRLNKNSFHRTAKYINIKALKDDYGLNTKTCISEIELFEFEKFDDNFISAKYIGFKDDVRNNNLRLLETWPSTVEIMFAVTRYKNKFGPTGYEYGNTDGFNYRNLQNRAINAENHYTSAGWDMIDTFNQGDSTSAGGFGSLYPKDRVSGYTIKQLEDAYIFASSWWEWHDNIKSRYTNSTEIY